MAAHIRMRSGVHGAEIGRVAEGRPNGPIASPHSNACCVSCASRYCSLGWFSTSAVRFEIALAYRFEESVVVVLVLVGVLVGELSHSPVKDGA